MADFASQFIPKAFLPWWGAWCLMFGTGCFHERSYPMISSDLQWITPNRTSAGLTVRPWLVETHRQLSHQLPPTRHPTLLTADLVRSDGLAIDVFAQYGKRFEDMDTLRHNFKGLTHTAHLSATVTYIDQPAPAWEGFEDMWVPIDDHFQMSARMGWAKQNGLIQNRDCIVIVPGLFGDNGVLRTRDLAGALRNSGYHVLAIEQRACGQTEARYPNITTCWGVLETGDLLAVSEWLTAQPHIRRTGLVSFCWGANLALLTGWADHRSTQHISITPELASHIRSPNDQQHYTAGIIAFSPVLQFEELRDKLDRPCSGFTKPILHAFQKIVKDRMRLKGYQPITGNLRQLIQAEVDEYRIPFEDPVWHGLRYLRLLPYQDEPAGDKLESVRVPTLIVQAYNDPLISAQDLADLMAITENPNIAALILPGGGHVGFPAYCAAYYYSLIMNFFDPQRGPSPTPVAQEALQLSGL